MVIDTEKLRTVKSVSNHLGIEKDYFRILMERNKIVGDRVRIDGNIYFIVDEAQENWGIRVLTKENKTT